MKKIAILLVFTLGTFIVNAQSVVEGTKFMDNWSVGVNAGAVTPLTHASFFKGMRPGFGVGISKQLTPSVWNFREWDISIQLRVKQLLMF